MAALAVLAVLALAAGLAFVGYKFGARAKAQAVKYEQDAKELYVGLHSKVSAKLASVKAEVVKIESEGKAEEKSVVARLKALL